MDKSEIEENPCWTEVLARDGSAMLTRGNAVTLFFEGDEAFEEMCREIEGARRCLLYTSPSPRD